MRHATTLAYVCLGIVLVLNVEAINLQGRLKVRCNRSALNICLKNKGGKACYAKHKCPEPGSSSSAPKTSPRPKPRPVVPLPVPRPKPRPVTLSTGSKPKPNPGSPPKNTNKNGVVKLGSTVLRTVTGVLTGTVGAAGAGLAMGASALGKLKKPKHNSVTTVCNLRAFCVCRAYSGGHACYAKHGCHQGQEAGCVNLKKESASSSTSSVSSNPSSSSSAANSNPSTSSSSSVSSNPSSGSSSSGGDVSVPATPGVPAGQLVWGAKVSDRFRKKVVRIGNSLGVNPNYLMACMAFETGRTFSPSQRNAAGSGATGLIQFMPSTARSLGTTTDALARMTAVQQLDFVKKYFEKSARVRTLEDVYMAILWPVAVGKPNSVVIFERGSNTYTQNSGLDTNRDGKITKYEAAKKVRDALQEGIAHAAPVEGVEAVPGSPTSGTNNGGNAGTGNSGNGGVSGSCQFVTPTDGTYTSNFKMRNGRWHWGIDVAKTGNVDVFAIAAGTVTHVTTGCRTGDQSCGGSAGNHVRIAHANGWHSQYFHFKPNTIVVSKGQTVTQGQKLGGMGHTGHSTGQHLHIEIAKNALYPRASSNYVDPCTGISRSGVNLGGKFKCPALRGTMVAKQC